MHDAHNFGAACLHDAQNFDTSRMHDVQEASQAKGGSVTSGPGGAAAPDWPLRPMVPIADQIRGSGKAGCQKAV